MKQKLCTFFAISHMLCIAVSTLAAGFVIESILVTGAVSLIVALIAFVFSRLCRRYWVTAACTATLLGPAFIIGELVFCMLGGPKNAALPMSILFLIVELITLICTFIDLKRSNNPGALPNARFSIRVLMIWTALFAIAFAVIEQFPTHLVPYISDWSIAFSYSWLVSLSLALFLLMTYGLYSTFTTNRRASLTGLNSAA